MFLGVTLVMGRKPRMEYEGGTYHVIQRGNNRESIFKDEEDKDCLIGQLKQFKLPMGYNVFGFVIMENHYHLVLQTLNQPLQSVMQRVNYIYSRYFNKKYGHYGHVFAGRYKAIPVFDDKYLLSLIRYIHQNPIKAGICRRAEEYRWSSDCFYRTNSREWVDIGLVLDMLSTESTKAVNKYKDFLDKEEKENYEEYKVIGQTSDFRERECGRSVQSIPGQKSLNEILLGVGVSEQDFDLIKRGSRQRGLTGYKVLYIKEALKEKYSLKAIGENIQVSDVAVLDLKKRYILIT